jgi:hypothetical protein
VTGHAAGSGGILSFLVFTYINWGTGGPAVEKNILTLPSGGVVMFFVLKCSFIEIPPNSK